jgi:hypothetical protein
MLRSSRYMDAVLLPILMLGVCPFSGAAERTDARGSISFQNAKARAKFEAYQAHLERDPAKFAEEIASLRQIERSDVQFHFTIGGPFERGVEGNLTTDGERVFVNVSDEGGPYGEVASLNSRFAHEIEHARQFDDGEIAFARDPTTGKWHPLHNSYDIGDEVKAWAAQLKLSIAKDFWSASSGNPRPTLLKRFADAADDAARAAVLARNGVYSNRRRVPNCNVVVRSKTGFVVRQLVRPSERPNFFGRIYHVV